VGKGGGSLPLIGTTETAVTQTLVIVFPRTLCTPTPAAIIPASFIAIAIWAAVMVEPRVKGRGAICKSTGSCISLVLLGRVWRKRGNSTGC
jgi:hypothetical protein